MFGNERIEKPIFFVGMPRSGTTLLLEVFSARSDLAWFSRLMNRFPWLPAVSVTERLAAVHPSLRSTMPRSDQIRPRLRRIQRLERLRLGPTEGNTVWRHWLGDWFTSEYLLGVVATEEERQRARDLVRKLIRYQGKQRFVAKLTGPGRVGYLSSVFPDAFFVHVIRDGRAVVHSLMNFPAWRDTFRYREPAWRNGLSEQDLARWRESGASPLALAAIEWRAVVESIRTEAAKLAPPQYVEVRYEDFLADPHGKLDQITASCELPRSRAAHGFMNRRIKLRDMNYQWRRAFTAEQVDVLDDLTGSLLSELGYRRAPADESLVG